MAQAAAYIYSFFIILIFIFHIGLIIGLPWGQITMGGQDIGPLPKKKRIVAFVALFLLTFFLFNVLSQSGLMFKQWQNITDKTIWIVVALNTLTLIGNIITKSKWERRIWAPVAAIMLVCVVYVAG